MADHANRARDGRRRAFTLLEVMVALVITGLVVLVAIATTQATLDARTRLTAHLETVQRARAAQEILRDALRNARAQSRADDPDGGVTLANGTLTFVAAGGAAPLDPDYDWRFTVAPGTDGLRVTAVAMGHAQPAVVSFVVPEVTRWQVWLLAANGSEWRTSWTDPRWLPRAIVIGFWHGRDPVGLPMHLSLWPGAAPPVRDSEPPFAANAAGSAPVSPSGAAAPGRAR